MLWCSGKKLAMQVQGKMERPKKRWLDNIREDMKEYNMNEETAENQSVWEMYEDKGRPIATWRRLEGEV